MPEPPSIAATSTTPPGHSPTTTPSGRSRSTPYSYFSQGLLTEYQEEHGVITGMWTDPRGHLHEPHTGNSVALGTREIAAYQFPEYTFDKILYVEKEGELPKLQAAKLGER
jgi:hypothetical protein